MKSNKITGIFLIIVLAGIIGGIFRLHLFTQKTASITIISNPKGAIAYLNGQEKGKTPLTINKIPQMEYNIKLVKEGFKIYEEIIKVKHKTRIEKTLIPLPPKIKYVVQKPIPTPPKPIKFGKISISSTPKGAQVYIDGVLQRKLTPMNINKIKTGLYKIKLVKRDYQPFESKLKIIEGETTYINAKLELCFGSLFINSTPPGATVYLNGEEKGKTPLVISNLRPWQAYQLRVSLFKHDDWTANVFVDPQVNERIEVNLRPKPEGFIYVTSIPSSSFVYLDDELIGKTPLRNFPLQPGDYALKVVQPGYLSQTKRITLLPDKSIFVNFELKKE